MRTKRTFEGLLLSEIKKAEVAANKKLHVEDCKVTGYSYNEGELPNATGFLTVRCEICHNYEVRANVDVQVEVYLEDRRRSFAIAILW